MGVEKEKREKQYPFIIDEYYSPGLNSLKRIYTQHPKFNGNTRLIYELLFDHWELARESGLFEAHASEVEKAVVAEAVFIYR